MTHSVTIDVKQTKGFCDKVYGELAGIKKKLLDLREYVHAEGADNNVIEMYERHLEDMINAVDWKIQILAHSCPQDWRGSSDFENDVQVDASEQARGDKNFSPGYTGG